MRALLSYALLLMCLPAWAGGNVTLYGTIQHPVSDSIFISFNDNRIAYYPNDHWALLDKKGHFRLELTTPAVGFLPAEIRHGNHLAEIILQPGDSLELSIDANRFDSSIHYNGRGAAAANFVAWHTLKRGRMNQYTTRLRKQMNKEPGDYLKAIEKERNGEIDFLNTASGLPAAFTRYWASFYQYYNYFFMQQYPQVHEIIKKHRYTDTIPAESYAVVKAIPLAFNDSFLVLPPYLMYCAGIFDAKLRADGYTYDKYDSVQIRKTQDSVLKLATLKMPAATCEYYLAQALYSSARFQLLARTEGQLGSFSRRWPNSAYLPMVQKQVEIARRLAPGQPAPDIELMDTDGKLMKLSDLKGKVVYLGFWAGWCKQCVGEMLAEKKVKDLIRNKPLVFAYVSLSADTAADNKLIRKYKISGVFGQASSGWGDQVVQQYGVQGLPAYYLIDEDGNFALQATPVPARSTELILAIEKQFKDDR